MDAGSRRRIGKVSVSVLGQVVVWRSSKRMRWGIREAWDLTHGFFSSLVVHF
jgi:hypothetical protein